MLQEEVNVFLKTLLEETEKLGINTQSFIMDHVAYSASSAKNYEKLKTDFLKYGTLIREIILSERRISVIKFTKPVVWNKQQIWALELIEPITGEIKKSEWEHVEFTTDNFDEILNKYPKLNWDTKAKDREKFARIKLVLQSGRELKFNNVSILQEQ